MKYIKSSQQGVGLVEVMVSLLILAVAVLGFAALQGQAIKVTDESLERSQSLVIMRAIGDKVRTNPTAIEQYQTKLNAAVANEPANKCGLDGKATTLCTDTELADAEAYYLKQEISNYGFSVQIHPCPSTGGTGAKAANNIMYSYCLLSAWGDTNPTIGSGDENCLKEDGTYHSKATCMMMEL